MRQQITVSHLNNYYNSINRAEYHKHPYDEMLVILSGDIVAFSKNSYFSHQGPCILFYKKHCDHSQINGIDVLYDRYYFNFDKSYIYDIFPDSTLTLEYAQSDAFLIPISQKEKEKMQKLCDMIHELSLTLPDKEEGDIRMKLFFAYLFAEITEISKAQSVHKPIGREPYIASVLRHISAHITEKLLIDEVARKFAVSRSKLTHDFNTHLSMTFNEYVTMERINRARTMLLAGEKLCFIAEKCGFCDSAYLIRQFKKNTGLTPADYRKKARENKTADQNL